MGGQQGLEPHSGVRCNAMWMRSLAAALLLGLLFAGVAQAKLNPVFSERNAEPGDTLELDLGDASEQFLGPLRIFLVSLEGDDRPQVKIGETGTPGQFGRAGEFDSPRVLTFKVPDLPEGEYTVSIWSKESLTGTWANALEGVQPLLTIGAAGGRTASDEQTVPPLWAIALAVGGVVAVLVAFGWRRTTRRAATGASPS